MPPELSAVFAAQGGVATSAQILFHLSRRGMQRRHENATPERIWRHFLDTPGTLHVTNDAITVDLNLRTYHPALIDAGIADLDLPIPWLDNRRLRFRFPPR